jgi:hypothetical protein
MADIPLPCLASASRIKWRTVLTVLSLAWIVAFVVIAALSN